MGDFQHAARLYVDNTFALTPKAGWMYYVFFQINPSAQTVIGQDKSFYEKHDLESGMLVKQVDLPKFQIQTEKLNQYNRRTVVQTKINYQPCSFTFHDDMSNVTNTLWWNYYRYYYKDSTWNLTQANATIQGGQQAALLNTPAYSNTKYGAVPPVPANSYGLNNNQGEPFFNSIIIYQMNRKFFTSYILVNPIVSSWDHAHLDQTSSGLSENKMTVEYENVFYSQGQVREGNPPGFATFHYDKTPSPLSIAGGGTATLLGPGGIIPGALEIFGDVNNVLNGNGSPLSLIGAGLGAANLVRNAGKLNGAGLAAEGYSIAGGLLGTIGANGGRNGNIPGGLGAGLAGLGGGAVGAGLALFKGSNNSTNGQTQADTRSITGGANAMQAVENTQGSTTPFSTTVSVPIGVLIGQVDTNDPTNIQSAIATNNSVLAELNTQLAANQTLQTSYNNAIEAAKANGGDINAINAQFASAGYTDPAKIQANIDLVTTNNKGLTARLAILQNQQTDNPSLAKADNTSGAPDPSANLNPTNNAESQATTPAVVTSTVPDANNWSI